MKTLLLTLILTLVTTLPVMAQDRTQGESWLRSVQSDHVCMVNDAVFNRVQIPVEVGGNTYYGCCSMCKGKLENDPASRLATDPVSGKVVDKSKAFIGAGPDSKVYYFENMENMQSYAQGPMPQAHDHDMRGHDGMMHGMEGHGTVGQDTPDGTDEQHKNHH